MLAYVHSVSQWPKVATAWIKRLDVMPSENSSFRVRPEGPESLQFFSQMERVWDSPEQTPKPAECGLNLPLGFFRELRKLACPLLPEGPCVLSCPKTETVVGLREVSASCLKLYIRYA